jgi:acyl dehydratase
MPARVFADLDALRPLLGQEVAVSDWVAVEQARIDRFAEASEDRQWIHLDRERCRRESPYGTTIAHGFLTLSLVSHLLAQAVAIQDGWRMGVNYGLNRVRFPAAVPAGALIRGRFTLQALEDVPGGAQLVWHVVVECQGVEKPCCVAEWVVRRYA